MEIEFVGCIVHAECDNCSTSFTARGIGFKLEDRETDAEDDDFGLETKEILELYCPKCGVKHGFIFRASCETTDS